MVGSISLDRRLLDWEWHDEPLTGWLWVNLLLMANHRDRKWHGMVVERGQLVTSRDKLCEQTGLTDRQLRTRLDKLVACECIKIKTTNRFTLISICKYDSYQYQSADSDQQATNDRPASDQQTTINNNNNNINNLLLHSNARVRECDSIDLNNPPELSDAWVEEAVLSVMRKTGLRYKPEEIRELYNGEFIGDLKLQGEEHNYKELRRHFANWLYRKAEITLKTQQQQNGTENKNRTNRTSTATLAVSQDFSASFDDLLG